MTALVVIAILVTLLIGAYSEVQSRMEKAKCMSNLRSLHVAAQAYMQDKHSWPQINGKLATTNPSEYAEQWIKALGPYHIAEKAWICPSVQRLVDRSPDIKAREAKRVDYIATPFDSKEWTPFKWNRQPWFVERGDVHGNGNLLIFSDGSTVELKDYIRSTQFQ